MHYQRSKRSSLVLLAVLIVVFYLLGRAVAANGAGWVAGLSGLHPLYNEEVSARWHAQLDLGTVAVWVWWAPGQTRLTSEQVTALTNAQRVAPRVIASVTSHYQGAHARTSVRRRQLCSLAVAAARYSQDVLLQNEPNLTGFFGRTQGSAKALARLYAHCYPRLRAAGARVWGLNTAPSHRAASFIVRVGKAYRALGISRPIMDGYAHHPYPREAGELPWAKHPVFLGMGDVARLRQAICRAFRRTAQKCTRAILYTESGVSSPGGTPTALSFPDPIGWVAQAHRLASCQRRVAGLLTFSLWDNAPGPGAWQTGLLDWHFQPKPGVERIPEMLEKIRAGEQGCAGLPR